MPFGINFNLNSIKITSDAFTSDILLQLWGRFTYAWLELRFGLFCDIETENFLPDKTRRRGIWKLSCSIYDVDSFHQMIRFVHARIDKTRSERANTKVQCRARYRKPCSGMFMVSPRNKRNLFTSHHFCIHGKTGAYESIQSTGGLPGEPRKEQRKLSAWRRVKLKAQSCVFITTKGERMSGKRFTSTRLRMLTELISIESHTVASCFCCCRGVYWSWHTFEAHDWEIDENSHHREAHMLGTINQFAYSRWEMSKLFPSLRCFDLWRRRNIERSSISISHRDLSLVASRKASTFESRTFGSLRMMKNCFRGYQNCCQVLNFMESFFNFPLSASFIRRRQGLRVMRKSSEGKAIREAKDQSREIFIYFRLRWSEA